MSRLYSSPEVIHLALIHLVLDYDDVVTAQARRVSCAPNRCAVEFHADFVVRRSQQRRVLRQAAYAAGCFKSVRPPKQAQVSRVNL